VAFATSVVARIILTGSRRKDGFHFPSSIRCSEQPPFESSSERGPSPPRRQNVAYASPGHGRYPTGEATIRIRIRPSAP
jgi:hypothetical protein